VLREAEDEKKGAEKQLLEKLINKKMKKTQREIKELEVLKDEVSSSEEELIIVKKVAKKKVAKKVKKVVVYASDSEKEELRRPPQSTTRKANVFV
jgi:hydroxylamine reductase (hybrid-cluster protein)